MNTTPAHNPPLPTWKYLLGLVKQTPGFYLLFGSLEVMIFAVFPQLSGLVIRMYFDSLTGSAPAGLTPYSVAALFVGVAIGKSMAFFADVAAYFRLQYLFSARLRKNLFERILERPGARAVLESPGEAVSRLREDVNEMTSFLMEMLTTLAGVIFSIAAVTVMSRVSLSITLIVFVPLVLVIAMANFANSGVQKYRQKSRSATSQVTGFIGEMFGAVQAVKVASAEEGMLQHFAGLNEERRRSSLRDRLFTELLRSIFRNTSALGTGLILLAAGGAMRSGQFTVGDLAIFVFYLSVVTDFLATFGEKIAWYKQVGVSAERMHALLQGAPAGRLVQAGDIHLSGELPAIPEAARTPQDELKLLEVQELTCQYPSTGRGIQNISFSMRPGTLTVITGRVGSGKTTLLRALLGLLPAQSGRLLWNGEIIRDPGSFLTPPRCAYTSQSPALFSESLRDNILMGLNPAGQRLDQAIRLAVMEQDITALPDGLESRVGARGVKLSGGQRQRAAAARMLVRQPSLLVFDDISSALDVETERQLWERLFEWEGGTQHKRTCLAVSHRRPALRQADQIIVLSEGRVVGIGTLDELLPACPELQQIYAGSGNGG